MNRLFLTLYIITLTFLLQAQDQNSLLWKIEGKNSTHASHLFGTMHSRDKRIFNLDTAIVPLIIKSSLYVPEVDLNSEFEEEILQNLILPDGKTLKNLFTKDEYRLIEKEFEKRSSEKLKELQAYQPYTLVMYLKRSSPYFLPLTLDEYLYKVAKDNGKEIRGLETIEEQISALSESYNPKHIYYYFKNIKKYDSLNEELRHAYMAEDNEAMLRFIADSSLTAFNMDILMDRRNDIMTSRIDSIVQLNSAFIAVGAGHLFGETGIISGLRKLGYAVTPVRNKKKMHQSIAFEINWKDYKSFNDNFSVSFPTTPDIQKNKEENVYSSDFIADGFISMTFNVIEKIDPNFRSMNTQTMSKVFLYAVQSEFSKETDFTVISSQYLESSEYFAREVLFNMNNEKKLMIHARFILAQDRLYILTVLIRPNTEDLESIRQFMDSFTILN